MTNVLVNILKSFMITILSIGVCAGLFAIGFILFNYSPLLLMVALFLILMIFNYEDIKVKNRKKKPLINGEVK